MKAAAFFALALLGLVLLRRHREPTAVMAWHEPEDRVQRDQRIDELMDDILARYGGALDRLA